VTQPGSATDAWSRATTNDGQTFVFSEQGDGPLVVLWHGFPDTPHGWTQIAGKLAAAGYRTVTPWLRGYHPETIVEGRGYDGLSLAADTPALLDALGEREAILVGHDWGATLVYGTAAIAPERVRAIVPIAIPHPSLLPRDPGTLWGARHFVSLKMPWAERSVRRGDFAYIDELYRRWAPNWEGAERDRALADVKECLRDPVALNGALDYYRALSPKVPSELATPPAIRGLVVGGTVDIVPPGPFERTVELIGDGSEVLIADGAGHWPHREAEAAFTERLIAFLAGLP
jgi:pimeloyl-ACP methyl ester carboxylesterase